jgi:hypothetical protein
MKYAVSLAALLLAGTLAAQVTVGGVTGTAVGAAVTSGTQSDKSSQPKDTKFGRSLMVSASVRGSAYASTHANAGPWGWGPYASYVGSVSNRGSVFSKDTSFKGTAASDDTNGAAHSISFSFTAKTATKGKLTVRLGGSASTNAKSAGKITVGTQSWSWKAGDKPVAADIDVTVDATGITATVDSSGSAALSGAGGEGYSGMFAVSFRPASTSTTCTVTDNQDGCKDGPVMTGSAASSPFGHVVTLKLANAPKGSIGLLLHSADGNTFKLNGCPIFTAPLAPFVFVTSATGTAEHRLFLPGNKTLTTYVGDVVLTFSTKLDITSSNTMTIDCK